MGHFPGAAPQMPSNSPFSERGILTSLRADSIAGRHLSLGLPDEIVVYYGVRKHLDLGHFGEDHDH
jgi:hypothetical protein